MKLVRDANTGLKKVVLEETDLLDVSHLEEMVHGRFLCRKCGTESENRGWQVLQKYLDAVRTALTNSIKRSVNFKLDEARHGVQIAKLVGFDHFLETPDNVIAQAEEFRKPKDTKENSNETNEYGD